jgi:2-dehydro-3-deoxygalactonokinase
MTAPQSRIFGNWGSTKLDLVLCNVGGDVIARKRGPGIASLGQEEQIDLLVALSQEWLPNLGEEPIWLCGAAGSKEGFLPTGYVNTPADTDDLAASCTTTIISGRTVRLIPGLSCDNIFGERDFLRGEETELTGLMAESGSASVRIICLPGTHSKWAVIRDGKIMSFHTMLTGELFALLRDHSLLVSGMSKAVDLAAFDDGVAHNRRHGRFGLQASLFSIRAGQIADTVTPLQAGHRLSGMVIDGEIEAGLQMFEPYLAHNPEIAIVGDPALTSLYARAMGTRSIATTQYDSLTMFVAGMSNITARCSTRQIA